MAEYSGSTLFLSFGEETIKNGEFIVHLRIRQVAHVGTILGIIVAWQANANPVTVSVPFIQLNHFGVNSLGFNGGNAGDFIRFGADSVVPNGSGGTTGLATLVANPAITRVIPPLISPVTPNFFQRNIPYDPALVGPWNLTFTNTVGTSFTTAPIPVSLPVGATLGTSINSITLSGTSANPTFTWTVPPTATVDAYRVIIFDKGLINNDPANGPLNSGNVATLNLAPNVTSHTVTAADFTVPGYAFTLGRSYSIEISTLKTRDGTSNGLNSNVYAISRVYADFTPTTAGGPPVNLPVVLANGSYQFNMAVQPNQTYYIDPLVATGYIYQVAAGNPNFASVVLPVGIGDNLYDIYGFDALDNPVLLADDWLGGDVFTFAPGGVNKFEVLGIETSAGLDPANATAFVTGLTFVGAGEFTGTQTPITAFVSDVPEPASILLLTVGLGLLHLAHRRHVVDQLS